MKTKPEKDVTHQGGGVQQRRVVRLCLGIFNKEGSGWLIIPILIGGFTFIVWMARLFIGPIEDGVWNWLQSISDPTEKGCAYIALAIMLHAIVIAFKSSTNEIKVNVEK